MTELMVRDALVECFEKAHCSDVGFSKKDKELNKRYCHDIVEKTFREVDGNFEKPTKEDLIKVLDSLMKFSENFREKEVIKRNYKKIMALVKRIK